MSDLEAKALEGRFEHRMTVLEEKTSAQARRFGERLDAHDRAFERIDGKIEDIVTLLSSRPTWLIAGLITILTTVTASLIVYVSTMHVR